MSVEQPGTQQPEPEDEERGDAVVRRMHASGGRHRRGRASTAAEAALAAEPEPLFSTLTAFDPFDQIPFAEPGELVVDLAEPERLAEREDATRSAPPPAAPPPQAAPPAPPAADPMQAAERPGRFKSFRAWWRQESLQRAAQKRALATAEAIMRAQAAEQAAHPLEKAPSPESYTQAVRGVMTLTEERFQALGLRSDRLQDELRGISRTMSELHGLVLAGSFEGVGRAAQGVLGTLEERFDALLLTLSDEFHRRAADTDRRLAEQLTLQSAELAALLESAVERIRAAIPEAFHEVRAAIPEGFEEVRALLPDEIERVREANATDFERIRAQLPDEIEKIRLTIPAEIERVKASIPEAMGRVVRVIPGQVERLTAENAEMLSTLRLQTAEALERIRSSNEDVLDELSATLSDVTAGELARFRQQTDEQIDRVRWAIPEEVDRRRGLHAEELDALRNEITELSAQVGEVITRIAALTSAASGEGDGAESR